MRTISLAVAALVMTVWVSPPAFALMDSKTDLANMASITMEKAVETAIKKVPGKAVEAEIEKEDGRPVYQVEIIDSSNSKRKVYVDARTGDIVKVK